MEVVDDLSCQPCSGEECVPEEHLLTPLLNTLCFEKLWSKTSLWRAGLIITGIKL